MRNCESFAVTFFSSFYIVADVLSTLLLVALSKPNTPPSEAHPLEPIKWFLSSNTCTSGGGGEIRTPVQNTFLFTSYSNITPVFINKLIQFWQIICLVFHKYLCYFFFGCNRNHNFIDWSVCNFFKHLSIC